MFKLKLAASMLLITLIVAACGPANTATPVATQPPATEAPTMAATEAPTTAPTEAATAAPTEAATQAPTAGEIDCKGAKQGDTVSMLYQWSGVEEASLNQILKPLADKCGIVVKPESTRDQALLDTRVKAGTPPDIAFWNVSQLVQYQDQLKTMDSLGANKDNYADFFLAPGTINDKWLGLPVKADIKTIIWYSPANFESLGYT